MNKFRDISLVKQIAHLIERIVSKPFGLVGLIVALILMWVTVFVVDRSFLVEAETSTIDITFAGEANAWNMRYATICSILEAPDFDLRGDPDSVCSPQLYVTQKVEDLTLAWACGATVSVQTNSDGAIVIELLGLEAVEAQDVPCRGNETRKIATGYDFSIGSLIVIESQDWRLGGALPFQAEATVGDTLSSGASHFLQNGRWEARQTSRVLQFLKLRTVTEVVRSGDLSVGVDATVFERGHPAIMWGHITPTTFDFENSLPGFQVAMLSTTGQTELRLGYYGFAEPARIRPNWVDTAITSPFLLAIFALLSLLAVVVQIVGDWPFRRKNPG